MQLIVKDINNMLNKVNISRPRIRYSKDSSRVLKLYKIKEVAVMSEENINILVYINNGTMIFNKREDTEVRYHTVYKIILKWWLIVYVVHDEKQLKTEMMYFLSTNKLK